MTLHELLDTQFGPEGLKFLRQKLVSGGADVLSTSVAGEMPLHVATRRRRLEAVEMLIAHGADIDAIDGNGKTAYTHAIRRGFVEISDFLSGAGCDPALNAADQLAVALVSGNLEAATRILEQDPTVVRTGNPAEDRLLADLAGRSATEPVQFLISRNADLEAVALDGGTALHQAAWFGQPANARLLIDAGASLNRFDNDHDASPLHWAVHGSKYSGGADQRQSDYVELVQMLLEAGSRLRYPVDDDGPKSRYWMRLRRDASPPVRHVLDEWEQ